MRFGTPCIVTLFFCTVGSLRWQACGRHTCSIQCAGAAAPALQHNFRPSTLPLQSRLAEEAERLAAQGRAAAEAQEAAAATLRAVQEDIDEETEQLQARCWCMHDEVQLASEHAAAGATYE